MPGYDVGGGYDSLPAYDSNSVAPYVNVPKEDDHSLIQRLQELYRNARRVKAERYETWDRNYRLVNNRIGGKAALTTGSWPPAPRDSEVFPILSSIVAWMADQHTIIDTQPATDPGTPFYQFITDVAEDLGTVLQSNWQADDQDTQNKLVIWDALIYGAGFFKTVWDQSLAGGLGNSKAMRVDPYSLYFDPQCSNERDAEYIVERRMMSLDEIERRWPGKSTMVEAKITSAGEIDSRPALGNDMSRIPKANPGSLPGGNGRWGGVSQSNASNLLGSVVVSEFWLRENEEWYEEDLPADYDPSDMPKYNEKLVRDRWRVVVLAANEILMDEYAENLYTFRNHPYDRYVFDDIGELYGISLVDHLAYPQIYINRLLSMMQTNAELVGNPIFLESAQSGLDRVGIINRPGQRLRVSGQGMQNKPDWLQPPSMPQQVKELVDFWIQRMENIAGISAASKGNTSAGSTRTSDQVMNTIQEAAFVRIRAAISNMERTLTQVGYKLADLIIDNYNSARFVSVAGPKSNQSSIALKPHHFNVPTDQGMAPLKYTLNINAGSALPTSRQARAQQADRAYAIGVFDRQAWYEANQIPNWQAINDRIAKQIADGSFNPPGARQRSGRKQ